MKSAGLLLFFYCTLLSAAFSQSDIHHWEALVLAGNTWKYLPGTSEPSSSWIDPAFDDTAWSQGPGGFGYGDGDDATIIPSVTSVFQRIKFNINAPEEIEKVVLLADFDDGFVAYLNGTEIARSGMTGERPPHNQFADLEHEANLYQNQYPHQTILKQTKIAETCKAGENVLCIQTHNVNAASSDLSSNYFLMAGLNSPASQYQTLPAWFEPPSDFAESNLPLIKISTNGRVIVDEPKITAHMGIISNGQGIANSIDDPFNHYDGEIGIEIRGSSSQMFPKKQYAIELWTNAGQDTSASLLGMPAEEDWVLYAPYSDKSLIRNVLAYQLAADQGHYAPRTRLCELFLNDAYMGVYVLMEKIKQDKNRVDVSNLNPDENQGDDLTGGYIVKIDKFDGAAQGLGWDSPYMPPNYTKSQQTIHFQYHYPKEDEITQAQGEYIKEAITNFEKALKSPDFTNSRLGYRQYIDVTSFIDFAIVNEVSRNVDGYRLSTYLHKDKNSKDDKIYIGPVWDYNLAFGNANYCHGEYTTGWAWNFNNICNGDAWLIPFWWQRLLRDPQFVLELQQRWVDLRKDTYSTASIMAYIDSLATVLDKPQQRNFSKWPVLSEWIWPNNYVGNSYGNEIEYLKNWISNRLTWLDQNIAQLEVVTGLEDMANDHENITVYPNPGRGIFTISTQASLAEMNISLHDQLGRVVYSSARKPNEDRKYQLDAAGLTPGIYILHLADHTGFKHSAKVIIE
ncbi:MAG: T9SS type A sorting domain-containing protein [Cyclobacteriaceae bacterium]|nr:T9SS type A sorting domain-containing protein [Cyclobacteriaceae bacterium]